MSEKKSMSVYEAYCHVFSKHYLNRNIMGDLDVYDIDDNENFDEFVEQMYFKHGDEFIDHPIYNAENVIEYLYNSDVLTDFNGYNFDSKDIRYYNKIFRILSKLPKAYSPDKFFERKMLYHLQEIDHVDKEKREKLKTKLDSTFYSLIAHRVLFNPEFMREEYEYLEKTLQSKGVSTSIDLCLARFGNQFIEKLRDLDPEFKEDRSLWKFYSSFALHTYNVAEEVVDKNSKIDVLTMWEQNLKNLGVLEDEELEKSSKFDNFLERMQQLLGDEGDELYEEKETSLKEPSKFKRGVWRFLFGEDYPQQDRNIEEGPIDESVLEILAERKRPIVREPKLRDLSKSEIKESEVENNQDKEEKLKDSNDDYRDE